MIDLETIATCFEQQCRDTETNIRTCGHCWKPEFLRQVRAEIVAIRACVATLRTPGLSNDDALAALTTACRLYQEAARA